MAVNPDALRRTLRQWTTGVTVVAAAFDGQRHGMTVNSFTPISLSPPLVLVSLEQVTRTHRIVAQGGNFGVTILASHQREISERFAGRATESKDRFENLETQTLVTGAPFLVGGLAFLDCQVVSSLPYGTHTLFIGEVLALRINSNGLPLLYFDQTYREMRG